MDRKMTEISEKLGKTLHALEVVIAKPMEEDRSNIDATIQRFEFCVELFWKLLKRIIESRGQEVYYPKDVLRKAYAGKLIHEEHVWLDMLRDRNLTSHTYDEALANTIYQHIKATYTPLMRKSFDELHRQLG